jgi:hypothetical protein
MQAENDLLSYDVSCISEVSLQCVKPAISLAMLYVNVVVSNVYDSTRVDINIGY